MFSRIFGFGKKPHSIYGNYGRFGQKNSSFTRKTTQSPRFMYKKSFYADKPKEPRSRSHKSRKNTKYEKSRRLGAIMNNSISIKKSKQDRKTRKSKY
jgi:hypothetical protein